MYGLPPNIDLSFFVEKTLLQVCFGRHDLILHFDENVSITITSSIGFSSPNGDIQQNEDFYLMANIILQLLEKKIVSVLTNTEGTLILCFENGFDLVVYDDSAYYESYVIRNGEKLIIV